MCCDRYFKILTQEMSVKVDLSFINAIVALFSSEEVDEDSNKALFKIDLAVSDKKLGDLAAQSSADEQKHFFDMLHVSPLKVYRIYYFHTGESL